MNIVRSSYQDGHSDILAVSCGSWSAVKHNSHDLWKVTDTKTKPRTAEQIWVNPTKSFLFLYSFISVILTSAEQVTLTREVNKVV